MFDSAYLTRALRHDFLLFVAKFFELLNPGTPFEENWHHEAMAAAIDRMMHGDTSHLLVTMPPRFLKSFVFSVALPAWLLGHFPSIKIVVVSYSDTVTESLATDCLRLMELELYRRIFPDTVLTKRTQKDIKTTAGGRRFSTTIGGSVTGMGGEWIIVDDPMNASLAYSEPAQKQVTDFFDHTLSTRADNPKAAKFIIVMQRLHESDLAGHVLARGGYEHLKLQAKATEELLVDLGKGRQHNVRIGDMLQPSRVDQDVIDRRLVEMGSAAFEAQYQQNPVPASGNQIKRDWLQRYSRLPDLESGIVVQSWDTATKTAAEHDYSVCTTWLYANRVSYLLNVWRGKLNFPHLRDRVAALHYQYSASHLLIEDAGSGASLIQDLKSNSPFHIVGRKTSLGKQARVDAATGAIQSGRILLPEDAAWLAEFERELLAFPGGRHDDQVDSVTQYVAWVLEQVTPIFNADFGFNAPVTMDSIANHILNIRGFGRRF